MKKIIDAIIWEEVTDGIWMLRPFFQKLYNLFSKKNHPNPDEALL